jgi:chromate transporter
VNWHPARYDSWVAGVERGRERTRPHVTELFVSALFLGVVGFGGGLSVLSNIRDLCVTRRNWLTDREFANTATVSQMLPGGAAANALAYIGLRFRGVAGALAAYAGFIFPGGLLTLGLAWAYVHFGSAPHAESLLGGFNAAVVGIIVAITLQMVRTGVGRLWQMAIAAGALLLSLGGEASSGEIALIGIGLGLIIDLGQKRMRLARLRARRRPPPQVALPEEGQPLPHAAPASDAEGDKLRAHAGLGTAVAIAAVIHALRMDTALLRLGLLFFRTGLGAYGGGFAIIPYLRGALEANHWLTARQFADAVAIGKLTPGPVLLMGTFIGYLLGGLPGALVSTLSVFAAPFALVVLLGTWLDRIRSRRPVRAALRGLTPAVVGLMAAAALTLGTSLSGAPELAIAAAVALTMGRFRMNPAIMLAIGGAARVLLHMVGV